MYFKRFTIQTFHKFFRQRQFPFAVVFLLIFLFIGFASAKCTSNMSKALCQAAHAGDSIIPQEIQGLWDSLSFKEKAAQTIMVYMPGSSFIQKHQFGGVLLMKNHLKDSVGIFQDLEKANRNLKIPLFVATDQEGGHVNRLSVSPNWKHLPSAKAMREMPDDSLEILAEKIGHALKGYGVNLNLAPVLDPSEDSRQKASFMEKSERSFGKAETARPKLQAFARGMRRAHILCTSKHFPGYDSWTNSDHQIAISASPKETVTQNAALFGELANDIPVIMMSSVRFIRYSNVPAVFEPQIVNLARQMAPHAVILTDDLWGVSLRSWISGKDRVKSKSYPKSDFRKLIRSVISAGNDMFMITYPAKAAEMIRYMEFLGRKYPEYRRKIECAAARIIRLKYESGILKLKPPSAPPTTTSM